MSTVYPCTFCGWKLLSQAAWKQHNKNCPKNPARRPENRHRTRLMDPQDFIEVFEDLPNGAFFAMAEEFGIQPEDFV